MGGLWLFIMFFVGGGSFEVGLDFFFALKWLMHIKSHANLGRKQKRKTATRGLETDTKQRNDNKKCFCLQ